MESRQPCATETQLRDWLRAIAEGHYEEKVRLTQDGRTGKGRGTIQLHTGPHSFTYSDLVTFSTREPWQDVRYSGY